MASRTLVIGDVHGCHHALVTLLDLVAVAPEDTLVFLGDLIDRGPSSRQVIDEVLRLREHHETVVLLGNHEEMMRDVIAGRGLFNAWCGVGGDATVASYGGDLAAVPPEHLRLLMTASPFYETERDICVHANLETGVSLANQNSDHLRWKHLGGTEPPHVSGKRVICGHTSQADGAPLVFDGWVCIDTCPHGGGWLTCLDADSDHVYQASQTGQTRDFPLSRYA